MVTAKIKLTKRYFIRISICNAKFMKLLKVIMNIIEMLFRSNDTIVRCYPVPLCIILLRDT